MKFGWIPDRPDFRDLGAVNNTVTAPLLGNGVRPTRVDLRETEFLSPIEDQRDLGSCTAQAVVGIVEYLERKTYGNYVDHSRLFLYRAARKLYFKAQGDAPIGDTGCEIRTTIKALAAFGCPPEWIWPYNEYKFDIEPPPDAYALAQTYKGLYYVKLDTVEHIKAFIRISLPVAFGFTCYESIDSVKTDGLISIPKDGERAVGGHAVSAVGYSDYHIIIRNSWGTYWGEQGYGYLPYWYFENGQCSDFWAVLRSGWLDL